MPTCTDRVGRGARSGAAMPLVSELDLSMGKTAAPDGGDGELERTAARIDGCDEPPETILVSTHFWKVLSVRSRLSNRSDQSNRSNRGWPLKSGR